MKELFVIDNPMKNPKVIKEIRAIRSTPEYKLSKSKEQKEVWKDPELLERHAKIIEEAFKNNPEIGKRNSERLLKNHPMAKKVKIKGVVYLSISAASRALKIRRKQIREKIKENPSEYKYV